MNQITEAPAWLEGLILVIVETPWGKIFEAALLTAVLTMVTGAVLMTFLP